MTGMDLNTVQQDLTRRFAAPLPEFYKRRIVFWYDEDREFEDQLDDMVLDGVKVARLTGSNTFAVKKLLCEDDTASSYLVYDPRSFTRDDDNWLINVQLYSEEFRADLNSIWMDEMGLPATPIIRNQVKNYRKFFRAKDRRDAVKKLNNNISTAAQMHLAVMSALCGNDDIQPSHIIRSVIHAGLDLDSNSIYQSFLTYGAEKPFWVMVAQASGYNEGDDVSLGRLAIHMLLTAATRTMHLDHLAGLDAFISTPHQAWCYDFVSEWLHSEDNRQLYEVARYVEEEARLSWRFSQLAVEDLVDTEVFPCINECILTTLMKEISDHIIQVDTIKATVEKRRTMVWYDNVSSYYKGLLQVANMQSFFLEHSAGFHTVEPHKIWKEYTTDYYQMDTYYRLFHMCFQKALKKSMKEFYETTGVVPAVITVENSAWQDDYVKMEQYAYDQYVNRFHSAEVYLLIVYSSENKDNGFDDWHYELMLGDDTVHIFTSKRTRDFNEALNKRLLDRGEYSVDEAISETLNEFRPKVMKTTVNTSSIILWVFVFFIFSIVGLPFLIVGLKPEKIPPEYKNAQPCNLTMVYQEACNFCGGVYIIGMHTSCPYCGAAITPHQYVRDEQGNVVQLIK